MNHIRQQIVEGWREVFDKRLADVTVGQVAWLMAGVIFYLAVSAWLTGCGGEACNPKVHCIVYAIEDRKYDTSQCHIATVIMQDDTAMYDITGMDELTLKREN